MISVQQKVQTAFHTEALARLVMLCVWASMLVVRHMPDSHCAFTAYDAFMKDSAQVCSSIYMYLA